MSKINFVILHTSLTSSKYRHWMKLKGELEDLDQLEQTKFDVCESQETCLKIDLKCHICRLSSAIIL